MLVFELQLEVLAEQQKVGDGSAVGRQLLDACGRSCVSLQDHICETQHAAPQCTCQILGGGWPEERIMLCNY